MEINISLNQEEIETAVKEHLSQNRLFANVDPQVTLSTVRGTGIVATVVVSQSLSLGLGLAEPLEPMTPSDAAEPEEPTVPLEKIEAKATSPIKKAEPAKPIKATIMAKEASLKEEEAPVTPHTKGNLFKKTPDVTGEADTLDRGEVAKTTPAEATGKSLFVAHS